MISPFLFSHAGDSPLREWAPPGPAVARREWCRLEEAAAVEYRDPLAPRPGTHRMTVSDVTEGEDTTYATLTGLGGRRLRLAISLGGCAVPIRGVEVVVRIHRREEEHWVTPGGLHLVGRPGGEWRVFKAAAEAERAAGEPSAEIVSAKPH